MNRLQKLRQKLIQQELEALVISQPQNRRYICGFTGSAGWLIISNDIACLAIDFRYVEQAKLESPDFEIVHIKGDLSDWLPKLASDLGLKRIGLEADHVPLAIYQRICKTTKEGHYQLQFIPTNGLVESLRAVKEPDELRLINEAAKLADAAFEHAKSIIHVGMTEREIAWELERFLREKGSEALPFDIIVASGPNAALPHAKPSNRIICNGEPILIDLGARVNGYCSDLSGTFHLGDIDKTFTKIYDIVLGAQLIAMATIVAGMSSDKADRLARTVIEQSGYGEAFGHGLGHGVGLEPHESPRLGPNSADILCNGMVFTIEPGIYIAGWGGIRIEDTVAIENGKVKALTKADRIAHINRG